MSSGKETPYRGNLLLLSPDETEIRRLQQEQNAYYFSFAFDTVMRKHGLISTVPRAATSSGACYGFVCRETPWQDSFSESNLVFEGPLHDSTISALGLKSSLKSAEALNLTTEDEQSWNIGYTKLLVRTIPPVGTPPDSREEYQPHPFVSEDPLWNRNSFEYQTYTADDKWRPILFTKTQQQDQPETAGLTNGRHIVLGLPIFDMMVFGHTIAPLTEGYYSVASGYTFYEIEKYLFAAARELFVRNGHVVVTVGNWPEGYSAAFTVRHDCDRIMTAEAIEELLTFYDEHGVKATWFWRKRRLKESIDKLLPAKVASRGHESGLHSEAMNVAEFAEEVSRFRQVLGCDVKGMTAHGGIGSPGYLGVQQHAWCLEQGLLYGEILGKMPHLPNPAVVVKNNIPVSTTLILPARHNCLDSGMGAEDTWCETLRKSLPELLVNGAHCVLMNHPDIHVSQVKQLIEKLPLNGVWKASMEEVCRWVRAAKVTSSTRWKDNCLRVQFPDYLREATVLNITTQSGRQQHIVPEATAAAEINLRNGEITTEAVIFSLEDYFDDIRDLIYSNIEGKGKPIDAGAIATVTVNTTALRRRAQTVTDLVEIGQNDVVAELGCGFGFFALAVHKLTGARLVGMDNQPHIRLGKDLLKKRHELNRYISFRSLDFVTEPLPEAAFDVVTVNNVFLYVVGLESKLRALRNIYRSLKPGGRVFFYHTNPWHPTEPFTKITAVHWLPRRLGNRITKRRGKRTMLDLDYQSPLKMFWMLSASGFRRIKYYPNGRREQPKLKRLRRYVFCRYYAMVAQKPGTPVSDGKQDNFTDDGRTEKSNAV